MQSKTVKVKQMLAVECGSGRMDFNVWVVFFFLRVRAPKRFTCLVSGKFRTEPSASAFSTGTPSLPACLSSS